MKELGSGQLKDRIEFAEQMEKYIPDFPYEVVSVSQYKNEELSMKRDEMSLVMLINKIQTPEDCEDFRKVSEELVNSIYSNAPEAIKEIYKKILWTLLIKMNVPVEWVICLKTWRKWTFRLKDEIHREKEKGQKRLN